MTHPIVRYLLANQFITALLLFVVGLLLIEIRGILVAIFIAYILMAALAPFVVFLKKRGVPNTLAVSMTYLATILLLVLLILPLVPFFLSQIQLLFNSFPIYVEGASKFLGVQIDASQIKTLVTSELGTIGQNAFAVTRRFFGGLFSVLTVLVVSFYLLIDHAHFKQSLINLFPEQARNRVAATLEQIEETLGAWLRGQVVLSLFIGLLTWVGLTLLDIDFALPLAFLAGMLEIVPTIGPIIAAIPAVIVALSISPSLALIVAVFYIVVQMLENNVLVPKIMEKAVGLNPIVIILGVMIGAKLMGVLGALLAIPFIALCIVLYRNLR